MVGLGTEQIIDVNGALDICERVGFYNFISDIEITVLTYALEVHKNKNRTSKAIHMNRTTLIAKLKKLCPDGAKEQVK